MEHNPRKKELIERLIKKRKQENTAFQKLLAAIENKSKPEGRDKLEK